MDGPVPGNWFAIAFKNWTNPKNDRIEQQGLAGRSCTTKLKAELYTVPFVPITLNLSDEYISFINDQTSENSNIYSILIPDNVDKATVVIKIIKSHRNITQLKVYVRSKAIPTSVTNQHLFEINTINEGDIHESNFYVQPNALHYIVVDPIENNNLTTDFQYSIQVNYEVVSDFVSENEYGYETLNFHDIEFYQTKRINHRDFFLFDIEVLDKNGSSTDYFNFTSGTNYGFRFNIYDTQDIGGMLTILIGLVYSKDTMSIEKASDKIQEGPDTVFEQSSIQPQKLISSNNELETQNSIIKIGIICVKLDDPGIPEWPGFCRYGNSSIKASSIVSSKNRTQDINIPFPEAGEWFLTARLFCIIEKKGKSIDELMKETPPNEVEDCNGTFAIGISSVPCTNDQCGQFGSCYHYMSGGFVYSTCVCKMGYGGWDCSDGSDVHSFALILFSTLLLTLSNLLFIPSVYFAIKRKYYTEALIYFCTMFFSSFYHACDSGEDVYTFCLVRLGVLQFCDFYCGLLAIWVTLIAMANLSQQYKSLAHMSGAVFLAFGTEYDKQSLTVFLAPALTGICIIAVSWGYMCKTTKSIYPSKRYLKIFLPLGALLVIFGLVCYAFLQTKQNYHIIHSVWHMVMALSILCLLPKKTIFLPK